MTNAATSARPATHTSFIDEEASFDNGGAEVVLLGGAAAEVIDFPTVEDVVTVDMVEDCCTLDEVELLLEVVDWTEDVVSEDAVAAPAPVPEVMVLDGQSTQVVVVTVATPPPAPPVDTVVVGVVVASLWMPVVDDGQLTQVLTVTTPPPPPAVPVSLEVEVWLAGVVSAVAGGISPATVVVVVVAA